MLFDDTDKAAGEALRARRVAQAQRSPAAVHKQTTGLIEHGIAVHSCQSLLAVARPIPLAAGSPCPARVCTFSVREARTNDPDLPTLRAARYVRITPDYLAPDHGRWAPDVITGVIVRVPWSLAARLSKGPAGRYSQFFNRWIEAFWRPFNDGLKAFWRLRSSVTPR